METCYIISFLGDDRPGLVKQVAQVVSENQGNWLDSQLSQLGGKFAGLILISLPSASSKSLETALIKLSHGGFSVQIKPATYGKSSSPVRDINLSIIGLDRPGIVRDISQAMTTHQVNVVNMESHLISAPMSGEMLFQASIKAQISRHTDLDEFSEVLDVIANEMTLDIDLN